MKNTLKVTTPGDREIVITREFDAPRTLVWDTMSRPELLKRWLFGPPGWEMTVCEDDAAGRRDVPLGVERAGGGRDDDDTASTTKSSRPSGASAPRSSRPGASPGGRATGDARPHRPGARGRR